MKKATLIILMVGGFFVLVAVALQSWIVRKGDDGIKEGSTAYARLVRKIRKEEKEKLELEGCEDCKEQKMILNDDGNEEEELANIS